MQRETGRRQGRLARGPTYIAGVRAILRLLGLAPLAIAIACSGALSSSNPTSCVASGLCASAQVCTTADGAGNCGSITYKTSGGDFQCASCTDCAQALTQATSACAGGSSSGSSSGGTSPSCTPGMTCADGTTMSVCEAMDSSGACAFLTYTVDNEHFTCAGCTDCATIQAEADSACAQATGSSSGSGSSGGGSGSSGGSSGSSGSSSGSSGSSGSSSGSSGGATYDGTTGKSCTTDADCQPAGGPGVNRCSNDILFSTGALFPTPVCILPTACDPGTDGGIHFCDGPDDPSSPGVCLPTTSPPETNMGICLPQCDFSPSGSAATGCAGKDQCDIYGIGSDASGDPLGIGYCYNGCDTDADCTSAGANQHCQANEGICVTTVQTVLPMGDGCDSTSTTTPTCNCIANTTTNLGYCGQFCKVGGTECLSGWICDPQLPTTLTSSTDATIAGWTSDNLGMAGFCAPTCSGNPGKTQLDGGACPTNSTCQTGDVGGPDCLP